MSRVQYFAKPNGASTTFVSLGGLYALTSEDKPAVSPAVLTQRYDTNRSGANLNETVLNVSNVNSVQFGLLSTLNVPNVVPAGRSTANYKAQVYAQPLYVPSFSVNGFVHNVLVVATQDNFVYAFDADSGAQLWSRDFSSGGEFPVPVPNPDSGCAGKQVNIVGNLGITSTPVIDLATSTIYIVDFACQRAGGYCYTNVPPSCSSGSDPTRSFFFTLHALDLTNGNDRTSFGSPKTLTMGGDSARSRRFSARRYCSRPPPAWSVSTWRSARTRTSRSAAISGAAGLLPCSPTT